MFDSEAVNAGLNRCETESAGFVCGLISLVICLLVHQRDIGACDHSAIRIHHSAGDCAGHRLRDNGRTQQYHRQQPKDNGGWQTNMIRCETGERRSMPREKHGGTPFCGWLQTKRPASAPGETSSRFLVRVLENHPPPSLDLARFESEKPRSKLYASGTAPSLKRRFAGQALGLFTAPIARKTIRYVTGNGYYSVTVNDVKLFYELVVGLI